MFDIMRDFIDVNVSALGSIWSFGKPIRMFLNVE